MSSPNSQDTTDDAGVVDIAVKTKNWVQFEEEPAPKLPEEILPATIKPETVTVSIDNIVKEAEQKDIASIPTASVPAGAVAGNSNKKNEYSGAVIATESVQINLDRSGLSRSISNESPEANVPSDVKVSDPKSASLKTIDLRDTSNGRSNVNNVISTPIGNIRRGFANGDTIVTLLPVNTRWPWITPAKFRPELVPEELMAQGLTLTVEDYVHVMELLVNDVRFNMYNICYKRILVLWIFTAFVILLGLLFSGLAGLTLFGLGIMWLILNAAAIFLCMFIKIKLNHNLEKCMAQVNKHLLRHKIIVGLDDRGKISCHKVNLCFIYFDTTDCVKKLQEVIEREEREGRVIGGEETNEMQRRRQELQQRMDIDDTDIVIQGSTTTRLSRKQGKSEQVLCRYIQRWGKDYLRRRLDWTVDEEGGNPSSPRHLASALCPCQYIEEWLRNKPRVQGRDFCPRWSSFLRDRGWTRQFVRHRLDLVVDSQERNRAYVGPAIPPRHCVSARCPCQFIEDHLKYKPRGKLTLRQIFTLPDFGYPPGFTWCAYLSDPAIRFDPTYSPSPCNRV
ncbi:Similar to Tmem268: Transmembrane protein 268 (Mus musculus) [Cotesia congregata]|uniref:Similar to Tmem268: Transmembrane protein 268 (Mus musculus) n=1 Tax=Cotesia congregata TaxID=51543 RepID=A0A8J2HD13_COTCN|nr:Similar to Tmem268: Transmembrane protein 268 (Mus musculus) [Cotesia congregata]